jgi:Tfp pilus assembly protein PilF
VAAVILLLAWLLAGAAALSPADVATLQSARNVGLAALEQDDPAEAARRFETVRKFAPSDPLGWADGAVAAMRQKDLDRAAKLLAQAKLLAPGDARVLALEGTLDELSGDPSGAVESFRRAAAASPKDLASRWAAARLESEEGAQGRRRAVRDLEAALEEAPANLFLLVRLSELARAEGEAARAAAADERLASLLSGDAKVERALAEAKAAREGGDEKTAGLKYRVVENLLRATPRYQQSRHDVDPGVTGLPLENWSPPLSSSIRAQAGRPLPVTFAAAGDSGLSALTAVAAVRVAGREGRDLAFAGPGGLRVASPEAGKYRLGAPILGSGSADLEVADVMNSGELDFLTPGALWVREGDRHRKIAIAPGEHVIPFDVDADGDLDLYVSARPGDRLLRNNLDGTFTDSTVAAGLPAGLSSRAAVAADLDRDGDIDLLLLRPEGGFTLLDNLRGGRLAPGETGLPASGGVFAAAAGDLDGDGRLDLAWTAGSGGFVALNRGNGTFLPATPVGPGARPLLFDFDNDGFLDLFLENAGGPSALFRNDGTGRFVRAEAGELPAARDAEAVDFDRDGDLDLAVVTPSGGAGLFENRGGNANGWIDVALEGLPTGSAKVNRFGYGSEIEAKAQDLYVYRAASRPVTHLGLGARRRADVVRIVWTNGVPQNALDPPARTLLREVQQLKGSCPFLYAFDGRNWHFVTDVLGRAPVGLLYDGVHQAAADTREWLVVPGRMLGAAQGRLTLDFTEELWEAVFFDMAELFAVDRPAGVGLVANEKMVPPPFPEKKLFTVSRPRVPRTADEGGRDRTAEIVEEDGVFLGGFTPTRYQGIVGPHELVLELPEAGGGDRVMLYLTGWIQYADTSINVSLSQRRDLSTFGPVLEVPDGRGGWRTAIPAMGYPAGKTKTMPVDLSGLLVRSDPRIRIRTNLEIYWDRIAYTVDDPPAALTLTRVPLAAARLFFRGFSRMTRETSNSPQVFVHDDVATAPRWADMAGLYTRFGDVRELLAAADDRYVVMKGGDAVRMEFDASALPPLSEGYERDWIFVSDGWDKDADKNTVEGQTVGPLPFHGMTDARYGELVLRTPRRTASSSGSTWTRRGGEEFLGAVGGRRQETGGRRHE